VRGRSPHVRNGDSEHSAVASPASLWQSAAMAVPFAKGVDPRRGRGPPPRSAIGPTLRSLARADRAANLKALRSIRDDCASLVSSAVKAADIPKGLGDLARVGVEAAKVLAAYSDGEPGANNVPTDVEETQATADAELAKVLELLQPPPPEAPAQPAPARDGGDAGSPGQGNGGEA